MIEIRDKRDCCGCNACMQCCPVNCIRMKQDGEGFLYPDIEADRCINCRLCEKVCPVINSHEKREPLEVYAAKNLDEYIRVKSSSGGIFTILAEDTISRNGVVFGARFDDDWSVVHDWTDKVDGLTAFRGAKYVQSNIGDSFKQVKSFLTQNRPVLFSGSPCQIAGLHNFLGKEYDNLLTVDFICHGVPSPKVWQDYLRELAIRCYKKDSESYSPETTYSDLSFRNKNKGWKRYFFQAYFTDDGKEFIQPYYENPFMKGFLADLYLRPSCHKCPAKGFSSKSDITIGDFWGIQKLSPEFDDDKGVSVVIVNSAKGQIQKHVKMLEMKKASLNDVIKYNPSVVSSARLTTFRKYFFKYYDSNKPIDYINRATIMVKISRKINRFINKFPGRG